MTQSSLFATRAVRREWLRRVVIPRFEREGRVARTARIKSLLLVVETYLRDGMPFAIKEITLANHMGVTDRTVRRAIVDAELLGLLTVKRSFDPRNASVYAIEWVALMELILADSTTAWLIEQPTKSVEKGGATPDNLATTPDNLATTPDNLATTPDNLANHPGQLDRGGSGSLYILAHAPAPVILNHHQTSCLTVNKPFESAAEKIQNENRRVSEGEDGKGEDENPDERDWNRLCEEGPFAQWPFKLRAEHLCRWPFVAKLWLHASFLGWVRPEDRPRFFRLAAMCVRLWQQRTIRDAGAKFTHAIREAGKTRHWPPFSEADVRAAQQGLASLLPREPSPRESRERLDREVQRRIRAEAAR